MRVLKILKACRIIVSIIIGLFIIACIALIILLRFSNLSYYVIISGSMKPEINIDDVVVSRNISETEVYNALEVGDVATYFDGTAYVTHRVYEKAIKEETGEAVFLFKGDNNNTIDKLSVSASQIRGKQVFLLPNGAWAFEFLNSVYGIVAMIAILLMLYMTDHTLLYAINYKNSKLQSENENSDSDGEKKLVDLQPMEN